MQHHAGDGVQCVACGLAHVIVVKQLGNDLGVGLGDEAEALVEQTLLDPLIVFNDSVVYDGNLLVTGIMRVCVDDGRLAMGRPAGMPMPQLPGTALPPSVISLRTFRRPLALTTSILPAAFCTAIPAES